MDSIVYEGGLGVTRRTPRVRSRPRRRSGGRGWLLLVLGACTGFGGNPGPEMHQFAQASAGSDVSTTAAPVAAAPAALPAPPPTAPVKRSAAELEKLVAPIALYPDPLIATMLPAAVYPLEIVQAARLVADTDGVAKLGEQPWDDNVKAVARVPEAIKLMNEDIAWTISLGDAFLAQDKDVMDAIQSMRGLARKAGTLQSTPQQVVVVTNTVVEIQPANPTTIYVPTYNPTTVYYPPPAYVYDPFAPLVTFGVGMAMGAIIANNCDWHHGGCYSGNVDVTINRNVNANFDRGGATPRATRSSPIAAGKKWQPDQSRLQRSGSPGAANSARSNEARGWGSGSARPSPGPAVPRASTSALATGRPAVSPNVGRPSASPGPAPTRSSPGMGARPSSASAFDGMSSGASARAQSSRGATSRAGVGGGFGGGSRASGGRGGGRR